jgi:hypothetical protein
MEEEGFVEDALQRLGMGARKEPDQPARESCRPHDVE